MKKSNGNGKNCSRKNPYPEDSIICIHDVPNDKWFIIPRSSNAIKIRLVNKGKDVNTWTIGQLGVDIDGKEEETIQT